MGRTTFANLEAQQARQEAEKEKPVEQKEELKKPATKRKSRKAVNNDNQVLSN